MFFFQKKVLFIVLFYLGNSKEGHKVKFGFPQQSFSKPYPGDKSWRTKGRPGHPMGGQYESDGLNVPVWYHPEAQPQHQQPQFHNFYLQRNSAPNIHTAGSNFAASFKKRHSFQEGVRFFQDKVYIEEDYCII